jgi:hypothetical protein
VGLYRPWNPSIDEGWTRWLAEAYDFQYTSLSNADVIAGDLRARYDVIVFADMSARQILDGFPKGQVPPRYAGGIGNAGVREIDRFARAGGTLVFLNTSCDFAIEQLHLPVTNVVGDLERSDFFMAGSIVEMTVDRTHPVMSGMPERSKIFVSRSPVFTVTDDFEGRALAKYRDQGSPLLSGYLLGEEHLHGYAAALDVKLGGGHVLLLGMRPQWRGQPFGNFPILFNSFLYTPTVADAAPENPDFWTPPKEPEAKAEKSTTG